ncbi:hypothetical protein RSOLAG22IIIB_11171 [Rhizoctonia solani]|uniref:Uncharacterized protein n=1 Tax=Rhizoctonia solani TaxID=456999 RepID=A0A0K6G6Y3_9AGAM|nr:hypothetical protein RSOLAG22IIIB_11171 [Rhizoctonia solani]
MLATLIEEGRKQDEERHKDVNDTLREILATVRRLETLCSAQASNGSAVPAPNSPPAEQLECPNPQPSDELNAIVTRVVNGARERIGAKKGGPEENSIKDHARTAWYGMLGINAAKDVRPFFVNSNGGLDTLPAFAKDPVTGYCTPYPNWKVSLAKQTAWIPTYLLRFRAIIPNDNNELSRTLRGMTDEQILIVLHDGPWKSARKAWRDLKKSDGEIKVMQSNARRYQRTDRKVTFRKKYLGGMPQFRGADWTHISHAGFMSADESDSEGELTTMRPNFRGTWLNNLYGAMDVAEGQRIRDRLGPTARIPARRIQIVDRPIPQLEHGSGAGTIPVQIAVSSLSKAWRDAHPDELKQAAPLINFRLTNKPSIDDFLSQHPAGEDSTNELGHDDGGAVGGHIDFPIDPQILQADSQSQVNVMVSETIVDPTVSPEEELETSIFPPYNTFGASSSEMPPPPVLDEPPQAPNLDQPLPKKRGPGRPRKSTTNSTEVAGPSTRTRNHPSTQGNPKGQSAELHGGKTTQAKKRGPGRPTGSKHKE